MLVTFWSRDIVMARGLDMRQVESHQVDQFQILWYKQKVCSAGGGDRAPAELVVHVACHSL
jgi:hypothetical protein